MNVYFACSITGGREFEPYFQAIVQTLLDGGHVVPTEHLAQPEVMVLETQVSPEEVYSRDIAWIRSCDTLIAEVSTPSHGVGYEIGVALGLGKPVLCCYHAGRAVSKMITGNPDTNLRVRSYETVEEAVALVRAHLEEVERYYCE